MAISRPKIYILAGLLLVILGLVSLVWAFVQSPSLCPSVPCSRRIDEDIETVAGAVAVVLGIVSGVIGVKHLDTGEISDERKSVTEPEKITTDPRGRFR